MPVKATYFTRFLPSHEMGGGSRRMLQIHGMLTALVPELHLISMARGDWVPKPIRKRIRDRSHREDFFAPPRWSPGLRLWSEDHKGMVFRLRKFAEMWAGSVHELPELDLAVLDDPIYFLPLFRKLRRLGVPIVAVSQNIESLAPHQVKPGKALRLLTEELEVLMQCRLVITVSREECFLLNNLGIRSLYVPYYPVEPILARLLAVREQRKSTVKEGILMVGTTKNLPTRDGMERAAAQWGKQRLDRDAGRLIIGGYKSETYFDPTPFGDSVDFRGTLTNEAMDGILSRVRALLSYQDSGAGVLTRNREMLIAGVPVLANSHAARSYYGEKGIVEFRALDDLGEALKRLEDFHDEIPLPQVPDVSALALEMKKILSAHALP